jgi:hypothetical protein
VPHWRASCFARQLLDTPLTPGYVAVFQAAGNQPGNIIGGVAQLGERVNGIHEVRGSIPLASMGSAYGPAARGALPLAGAVGQG